MNLRQSHESDEQKIGFEKMGAGADGESKSGDREVGTEGGRVLDEMIEGAVGARVESFGGGEGGSAHDCGDGDLGESIRDRDHGAAEEEGGFMEDRGKDSRLRELEMLLAKQEEEIEALRDAVGQRSVVKVRLCVCVRVRVLASVHGGRSRCEIAGARDAVGQRFCHGIWLHAQQCYQGIATALLRCCNGIASVIQ